MRTCDANARLPCLTKETVDQLVLLSEMDSIPLDVIRFDSFIFFFIWECSACDIYYLFCSLLETVFSSSACLNSSFLADDHFICSNKNHGINFALAKEEFCKIKNNVKNPRIIELVRKPFGNYDLSLWHENIMSFMKII